jgi:hypothetical protein
MTDDSMQIVNVSEEKREQAAADAFERIKRGQHWLDWMDIGEGLAVGRTKAFRTAGTNNVQNPHYKRAFKVWMSERPWARDLDQPTRAHLFWCVDNRNDLERWRETLATNERARLNHPTATKRRYEAAHRGGKDPAAPAKETERDRLLGEIKRLTAEKDAWRKRAEAEGSLFDLKKDTIPDMVRTISGNLADHRFNALTKGLVEEQARRKAERKQAG